MFASALLDIISSCYVLVPISLHFWPGFSLWIETKKRGTVSRLNTCTVTENNCKSQNFVDIFTKYLRQENFSARSCIRHLTVNNVQSHQ